MAKKKPLVLPGIHKCTVFDPLTYSCKKSIWFYSFYSTIWFDGLYNTNIAYGSLKS
jgi:hypothetical protein